MACLCLSDCCQCGPSLYKPVTIISVLDMMTSIIFVTYETANFGLLTGIIPYDKNCTVNCTSSLWDFFPENLLSKFDFETYTVMALIVLIFLGFIIEGSLYSKLKSGKRLKIHYFCKKWLEIRLLLLLITIFMAIAKYFRGFYSLYFDGVIDVITKTYRIISLCIVKCFMKEVEVTVGVAYVKPPKPRKRGSLSLK